MSICFDLHKSSGNYINNSQQGAHTLSIACHYFESLLRDVRHQVSIEYIQ